jgi:hypothetical protein
LIKVVVCPSIYFDLNDWNYTFFLDKRKWNKLQQYVINNVQYNYKLMHYVKLKLTTDATLSEKGGKILRL